MAASPAPRPAARDEASAPIAGLQRQVLATLWLTYGSFYLCRTNISPAVPDLMAGFRLTKYDMGLVLGGTKLAYAAGQLINGQIANRLDSRRMLALGMALSIAMNLLFGFATGFYFMLSVWFVNGFAQSMGWPPTVRVMAHWFPALQRGRAMGILGTSYQVGSALTIWGVGALLARSGDWRVAFWAPSALMLAAMVVMLRQLRTRPDEAEAAGAGGARERVSVREGLAGALLDRRIWLFGLVLAAVDVVRYGYLDWTPTLLRELQGVSIDTAALKTAAVPLGGAIGAVAAGWVSDRFFGGRRAPVVALMLASLALLTAASGSILQSGSSAAHFALFGLAGILIYGPQVIVVGTLPQDFASPAVVAGAAGFINSMGYLGAWIGDVVTGRLAHSYGWDATLTFWSTTALAAALLVATQWRARPTQTAPPGAAGR